MKNLSKLSLLVVFLSTFISTPVFAATPTPAVNSTPTKAVLLASVNIKDAKIVSQKENVFNISFSLSNGAGLQTGVKYGVKLVQESKTGQMIIDERVYDESLTLNANMTTKKDIIYTAPASLSGSYALMLTSNNSSGFPFGIANLGKVTLTATTKGIEILSESCTLQIVGDKTGSKYSLASGVGINSGESISLTCEAMNSSKVDVTATPFYEVHSGTSFGDIIAQSGGSVEPITFKALEKKSFSVTLPKATTPQVYNVNFTLNNKDNKSNSIDINYMVLGVNATVENISLDKDYYNKGDTALLSLVYKSNSPSAITSKIQISDSKDKSCTEPQTQTLTKPIPLKIDTSIAITSSCVNPKISVTLTDDKGVILAQKEFNVKTTSIPTGVFGSNIIYIIIILLVIIALYIYFKKKKNTPPANPIDSIPTSTESTSVPMAVLFFFLLIASFGIIPTHKASADTYGYNDGSASGSFVFDQSSYSPGGSVGVFTSFVFFAENYGYGPRTRLYTAVDLNGQRSNTSVNGTSIYVFGSLSGSFTAPSTTGSHSASLTFSYSYNNNLGAYVRTLYSNTFSFPYTVVAPPAQTVPTVPKVIVKANGKEISETVPYKGQATISWEAIGFTGSVTCDSGGHGTGPSGRFDVLDMTSSQTFTIACTDSNGGSSTTGSCVGTISGSCGPNNQNINCGNLRLDNTPYNCESLGCVWHGSGWSGDQGYCDNQNYMACTDMQSEDTCNVVSCSWSQPISGSCSTISDSSSCSSTSGCTWQ
ncbi:MAG: hypothetical protein WC241_02220 [Candidatus Paceibacterota bacterium]|jgi:LPXTG-motif cell wall-anchored protein